MHYVLVPQMIECKFDDLNDTISIGLAGNGSLSIHQVGMQIGSTLSNNRLNVSWSSVKV